MDPNRQSNPTPNGPGASDPQAVKSQRSQKNQKGQKNPGSQADR